MDQSLYKIASNELLAFNHIEKMKCGPAFGCDYYATGISYSSDNGRSWTFCGEIVKPKGDRLAQIWEVSHTSWSASTTTSILMRVDIPR